MTGVAQMEMSLTELEAEVALYRQARAARLTSEKGWLTLIAKVWLMPGRYRVGSAPGSEILLPADRSAPELGTITLDNGIVRLEANPSAELYARDARVTSMILRSDAETNPDDVVVGSLTLQLIRRGDDLAIRVRDSQSAARRGFPGLPAFRVDPAWRIVADLDVFSSEREVVFDDSDGRPQRYSSPGVAVFEKDGVACRLLPVFESDRKRLFVLFSDVTNGDTTYGAGRFLYVPLPERRRVVLDFNKAFNPPCAFTPYAVCPLPHGENRLGLRVEAGEKLPYEHT